MYITDKILMAIHKNEENGIESNENNINEKTLGVDAQQFAEALLLMKNGSNIEGIKFPTVNGREIAMIAGNYSLRLTSLGRHNLNNLLDRK